MKKYVLVIVEIIKLYVGNFLNNEEFVKVIYLLNDIDNVKVWIFNIDKSIIIVCDIENDINYINDLEIKNLYDDIDSKVLEGVELYDEGYNFYYNEDMMMVVVLVKENEIIIGVVIFNFGIIDLLNFMNKFFLSLILVVLGELIIVGILGYYLFKNILMFIKKINLFVLELVRGYYGIKINIY